MIIVATPVWICEVCWRPIPHEHAPDDVVVRPIQLDDGSQEFAWWHADHFPGQREVA